MLRDSLHRVRSALLTIGCTAAAACSTQITIIQRDDGGPADSPIPKDVSRTDATPPDVIARADGETDVGDEGVSDDVAVTDTTIDVPPSDAGHESGPDAPGSYAIGGKVSGLTGAGLILQDNDGDNLAIATNGSFTFATRLSSGSAYSVTVFSQPTAQTCTVKAGSGTVAGADVTTVRVTCTALKSYTVGGTLTGLVPGDGGTNSVVLQDNLSDDLSVTANGSFTFAAPVLDGAGYSVTVLTDPTLPPETCGVSTTTASGTVSSSDVTNVSVTCVPPTNACGRYTSGATGSWTTAAPDPLTSPMGFSDYVPPTGTATIYLQGDFLDSYDTGTDAYTTLTSPPFSFTNYGSLAWLTDNSFWSFSMGFLMRYDVAAATWTTPIGVLPWTSSPQTTSDDYGNIWSYENESTLFAYDVTTGLVTTHPLTTGLTSSRPRITFDSCSGLFFLTDYNTLPFFSYDPSSGTQITLASLPAGTPFTEGFCGDRSGHVFAVTNTGIVYQYSVSSATWTALPTGGPALNYNTGCGVGADGFLYATDPDTNTTMYRIQLN
jgi:hypothetical protein